ncbi:MAG: Gmad2 immunoglobulin-like domain-containing protein [Candidatus Uhrbacteria bacterium]|nr:Gmad2 immunoglobulin-like domain-containing protein [Candidatus Uhrbacteria bacterium]
MLRKLKSKDRVADIEGNIYAVSVLGFVLLAVAGAVASMMTLDEPVMVFVGFGVFALAGLLLMFHGLFVLIRGAGWMPGRGGTRYISGTIARFAALFYVLAALVCWSFGYAFLASACEGEEWCAVVVPVTSYETCAHYGGLILESYPARCIINGKTFTQDVADDIVVTDEIIVTSPTSNQLITSPLTISGEAVGGWYFEASFPVKLLDADGNVVAQHYVMATDDWMTSDFVPFEGELEFTAPATDTGTLVLMKDNPSGLPENDDSVEVPVTFR